MGRTRGSFVLPGVAPPSVIATVAQFAGANGFAMMYTAPNQVVISRGSVMMYGKQTVIVTVFDGPQGAAVAVEAWIEIALWGEFDANPRVFVGAFPRRALWKVLTHLAEALGAPGVATSFHHGG
jgi:hypothetical protein